MNRTPVVVFARTLTSVLAAAGGRALLLGVMSLALAGAAPAADDPPLTEPVSITVVSNGWHTGIALPIVLARRLAVSSQFPGAAFLEIGFGDEAFYRDPDPGPGTVLRAIAGDGPAVLHVFAMRQPPVRTFLQAELVSLQLSADQADALRRFIGSTFRLDDDGRPIDRGPGHYSWSRFYGAIGSFSLGHTCNTWAARALQAAGLPISAAGVVTSEDLLLQLEPLKRTAADRS